MNENDKSKQEKSRRRAVTWITLSVPSLVILCAVFYIVVSSVFTGGGTTGTKRDTSTNELRTYIESIEQRNIELIADNRRLTNELAESTNESRELGGIIGSALELAERSAVGFTELTRTLGNGSSELAVIIERQRTINTMVIRLQEENRQLVRSLRASDGLGRTNRTASSGE
jgi:predicted PurR-regulated permease PerM